MFGSGSQTSGAPDLIVTSSNSGLQAQEGMDKTALDMQVFARGGAETGASVSGGTAEAGEDEGIDIEESEEGGVSSISSSSEQQPGQGPSRPRISRQTITWGDPEGGSSSGTTSSSPQRQVVSFLGCTL